MFFPVKYCNTKWISKSGREIPSGTLHNDLLRNEFLIYLHSLKEYFECIIARISTIRHWISQQNPKWRKEVEGIRIRVKQCPTSFAASVLFSTIFHNYYESRANREISQSKLRPAATHLSLELFALNTIQVISRIFIECMQNILDKTIRVLNFIIVRWNIFTYVLKKS